MSKRTKVLLVASVSLSLVGMSLASFNNSTRRIRDQEKPAQFDLPGTIDGAIEPSAIPRNIAYELFLRVLGESSSIGIAQKAGLDDQEAKIALDMALSFIELLDQYDRAIKSNDESRIPNLQQKRSEYVAKEVG